MRALLFTALTAPVVFAATFLNLRNGVYVTSAVFPVWALGSYLAVLLAAGGCLELSARALQSPRPSPRQAGIEALAVFASLLAPAILDEHEFTLAFLLASLVGWRILRPGDTHDQLAAAIAVGLDFAVEAILVNKGTYAYRFAGVSPLPLWLPMAWANVGIGLRRLYPLLPDLRRRGAVAVSQ